MIELGHSPRWLSVLEFAHSGFPSSRRDKLLLMLHAYWDESGRSDDPQCQFMGMGGLIASAAEWALVETAWQQVLTDFGLPYFHMREYAHWSGHFKDRAAWPESRRRNLMARLIGALAAGKLRVHGAIVDLAAWRGLDQKYQTAFVDPWFCCFQECARIAAVYCKVDNETVDMWFSQQAEFIGKAAQLYGVVTGRNDPAYRALGSFSMKDMRQVLPLQAADLVAYEALKFANQVEAVRDHIEDLKPRVPFQALLQIDPHAYIANIDAGYLQWQCEGLKYLPPELQP